MPYLCEVIVHVELELILFCDLFIVFVFSKFFKLFLLASNLG